MVTRVRHLPIIASTTRAGTACHDARMPASGPRHATSVAAVTAAAVLFATTGTARSLGPDGADAWAVGTWRILVGALALWAVAGSSPKPGRVNPASRRVLLLGSIGVAAYQPGFFIATDRCGVALGTLIALGSGPVFTVAGEAITRGSRPGRRWWFGTFAMIAGVALLGAGDDSAGVTLDGWGALAGLGAGAGYALYAVATRRAIDAGVGSTRALAWQFTLGAVILSPGLLIASSDGLSDVDGILMITHLGVLTVGLAYFLYGVGLRHLAPATAVSITVIEPVAATAIAAIVLDERPSTLGWIGALVVIAGFSLLTRRDGPSRRAPRAPRTPTPTPSA